MLLIERSDNMSVLVVNGEMEKDRRDFVELWTGHRPMCDIPNGTYVKTELWDSEEDTDYFERISEMADFIFPDDIFGCSTVLIRLD